MARSLELPAVVGTNDITERVKNGDMLVLDAINNQVIINPTAEQLAEAKKFQAQFQAEKDELAKLKDLPAITLDGHQVEVCANIRDRQGYRGCHPQRRRGRGSVPYRVPLHGP